MERFLIPKDSYIDIQKDDVDGKMYITVTVEPKKEYKKGDILTYKYPNDDVVGVVIFDRIENNRLYFLASINRGGSLDYDIHYVGAFQLLGFADDEYRQKLFDAMEKDGKRWNADEKCVEDIPQRKFKDGDKVRIKDGISSETHMYESPSFIPFMDELIGKELTVKGRSPSGHIQVLEATCIFAEGWLEPWSDEKEELKKGDLAIFWDINPEYARIAAFSKKEDGIYLDSGLIGWIHAAKFECTKEQKEFFNKVRKGEL